MEKEQKSRTTARNRAFLDRALLDLLSFYRDVIIFQAYPENASLINEDVRSNVITLAGMISSEQALERAEAILNARKALAFNVAPLLALESLMISLRISPEVVEV